VAGALQPWTPGSLERDADESGLELQNTPGYRPGDDNMAISTIHEVRFVLFDDDTRLAFVTSFDGPAHNAIEVIYVDRR
jgi:hypothetical protein